MRELEIRIFDIDVEEIRRKLEGLNAIKVKEENQINNIYDFKDNFLLKQKGYARIRLVEDKLNNREVVYMTTKKMLSQGTFKEMEENETIVEDKEAAERIFLSLGLELKHSIKKYRESYKLKDSLIEIDINDKSFCPFPYIEIETKSLESLKKIVNLLGYTLNDTSSKTIYEFLEERGLNKNKTAGL